MENTETVVEFIPIAKFKEMVNADKLDVIYNEKTEKHFVSADNGETYKAQGDLDVSTSMVFMRAEGEDISEACLINGSTPIITL